MENHLAINAKLPWLSLPFISESNLNPILDYTFHTTYQFFGNWYPILDKNSLIYIPYTSRTYLYRLYVGDPPQLPASLLFWSQYQPNHLSTVTFRE